MEMDISFAGCVALCGVTLVSAWLVHWVYRWMNPFCNGVLPPGSMGFPIIGETLAFLKASPSLDIPDYFKLRMKRYGPVFKTSLLGQPAVISTDAEANRFILQQEGTMFRLGYPRALTKIFGEKSIEAFHGTIHKFIRRCAYMLFGLQTLKETLLPEMEASVRERLAAWAAMPSVDVRGGAPDARKNIHKTLRDTLAERLGAPAKKHGDLLDIIVEELQGEEPSISEDFAIDMLSTLLFASVFTLSGTIAVAFKSLHDNPDVVQALHYGTEGVSITPLYNSSWMAGHSQPHGSSSERRIVRRSTQI
uniref:Secologanin synthase n=1 Tax=Aegilops tauschii subsp. strangulata TaxID=200361 RepID=A0A453A8C7_AEGTS